MNNNTDTTHKHAAWPPEGSKSKNVRERMKEVALTAWPPPYMRKFPSSATHTKMSILQSQLRECAVVHPGFVICDALHCKCWCNAREHRFTHSAVQ